jgi:signal transduction histidine kinase
MLKNETKIACNRIMACLLFLLSIYAFNPTVVQAQPGTEKGLPFIKNYSPKSFNAPTPQVWSAIEDNKGIMYFGSLKNILEYDGIKWKKIELPNASWASLVRSLVKDSNGVIYYSAYNDFGYLYTDSTGQTEARSLIDLVPESYKDFKDVLSVCVAGNEVYFMSNNYIFRINKNRKTIKTWKPQTQFTSSFYLDGVYYLREASKGLYKMVNDSITFIPGSEFIGNQNIRVMLPFAGTTGQKEYLIGFLFNGLYLFDGKNFRPFVTRADSLLKLGSMLYGGVQLPDHTYALSTVGSGVVIIDSLGNELEVINRKTDLQDEAVYANYLDKNGNLWLGLDNGASMVELSSPFTKFGLYTGLNSAVNTITRLQGNLYAGTTNGLFKYDEKAAQFKPVAGIPQTQIFTLTNNGNELLVPAIGLFSIINNKVFSINRSGVVPSLYIAYISKKYPDILLGGSSTGIYFYTRQANQLPRWQSEGSLPGLKDKIMTFAENDDGTIWAGTQSGAVYKITLGFDENGKLDLQKTTAKEYGAESGYQSGGGVVHVNGSNYFLGDSLIYSYNEKLKKILPDSTFGSFGSGAGSNGFIVKTDSHKRVWLNDGVATRLAIPKPGGGYIVKKDQLSLISDYPVLDFYADENDILWICSTEGLIRYDEKADKSNNESFSAIIRSAASGKNLLGMPVADNASPVGVSFKNNSLRFDYAAPFFEREDKTQFQTWLEGFENTWTDFDNNAYKEYTNLGPGKYVFHVRAKNIYGNNSREASYAFEIITPWYNTWWAYILYALLAALLVYAFIHWRTKALQNEKSILEKKVSERTAALKTSLENLKATQSQLIQSEKMASLGELTAGIAHEIQNPLNFVNNFSEVNTELIDEASQEIASGNINEVKSILNNIKDNEEKINHHGKRADAIVKGMLQHSRKNTGQKEPTDINALCDEFLRLSYHGLRAKNKSFNAEFTTEFDDSIGKINIVPQDMGRVLLNLFNNAFYAVNEKKKVENSTYIPTVGVATKKLHNTIEIIVKDNGDGIPQNVIEKIFQPFFTTKPTGSGTGLGLSLAYEIVKAHGGEIKVETRQGEGSRFIIQLPVV